jgi:hypothetical protein
LQSKKVIGASFSFENAKEVVAKAVQCELGTADIFETLDYRKCLRCG